MKRYAIISDIHGNLPALESVENDFLAFGVDGVINLGDHASGPLWPQETLDFLMSRDWLQIRGNQDRVLSQEDVLMLGPSDTFAFRNTLEQQRNWLSDIPKELVISPEIFVFHGSPEADDDFLLEQTIGGRKCLGRIDEIEQKLWKLNFKVFLCGHSHLSRCVRLRNGSLIINPGSVGLQAYKESCEVPYRVENGSPHARYAILEQRNQQWTPSFRLIEYDWDSAAKKAAIEGRLDWEVALLTGFTETRSSPYPL